MLRILQLIRLCNTFNCIRFSNPQHDQKFSSKQRIRRKVDYKPDREVEKKQKRPNLNEIIINIRITDRNGDNKRHFENNKRDAESNRSDSKLPLIALSLLRH